MNHKLVSVELFFWQGVDDQHFQQTLQTYDGDICNKKQTKK